jgi:hypothetical protein
MPDSGPHVAANGISVPEARAHVRAGCGAGFILATGLRRPANTGQVEFSTAVKADLIGSAFDGENAAQVPMPAAKNKLQHARERFH